MAGRGQIEGSQIINYTGNAGLALGGGAGLDVYGETSSKGISETVRDVALHAFARNQQLWRQRIEDRDKVRQMIDDDKVVVGDILEQQRPYVEEKQAKADDFFYKNVEGILDNPAKYREYKTLLQEAKDAAKQANTNFVLYSAEQKELGKTTNPYDANRRKQFLSTQLEKIKSNPNSYIDPFVPISNFDPKNVDLGVTYGNETLRREGNYNFKESKVDVGATMGAYQKQAIRPEVRHEFDQYASLVVADPRRVASINQKLQAANARLGLTGANAVKPITQYDLPYEIAAKVAIADNLPVKSAQAYADKERQDEIQLRGQNITDRHNRAQEALGWARIAQDDKQLEAQKDQWKSQTKGGDTTKNAAFEFANRVYADLTKLADKHGVISPDKIRQMNAEQLKYIGVEKDGDLQPLSITDADAIQLENGSIRILRGAKPFKDGTETRYKGNWDQTANTNVYNIATNRLNEENRLSGSKEINGYVPIDMGTGGVSENTTGASTTVSGSSGTSQKSATRAPNGAVQNFKANYSLPDGSSKSLSELRKFYSDAQIRQYIKDGTIK